MYILAKRRRDDRGTSLIEVIVAMLIFTVILGIVGSFIITMLHQQSRQSNETDDLTVTRNVNNLLDNSLRYANAISAPGIGTDGNYYVEWENGDTTQADNSQTCTQWRLNLSAHSLQTRSWQEVAGTLTGSASAWATKATNVYQDGSNPVWVRYLNNDGINQDERLGIDFVVETGNPSSNMTDTFQLAAVNSQGTAPTTVPNLSYTPPSVCTQVGRP